jgi:hypothetical protein
MRGRKELAMCVIEPDTPRYQLPFEELPRGFVKFPERVIEGCELQQQKAGMRFSEDFILMTLESGTLIYYYQGYPVAYRSVPGGIEVLGVGWEEIKPSWHMEGSEVKVVQP